jgi:two-component system cell cycle sensor histidine kinase/response regulator CckA
VTELVSEVATESAARKQSTVLLLDDDANTLLVLHAMLESTQARVIECENETCAVHWCEELQASIDLLVADVILKASTGPAVVRRVKPLQPLMRLLFISGFSLAELQIRGLLRSDDMAAPHVEFLQKPFSHDQFRATIQSLLED